MALQLSLLEYSGSPVTKSPLDLFKQCEFLQPDLLGYSSYYAFRARYAKLKNTNFGGKSFQLVVGYKNLDELSEIIKPFSDRVLKKDICRAPAGALQISCLLLTTLREQYNYLRSNKSFTIK